MTVNDVITHSSLIQNYVNFITFYFVFQNLLKHSLYVLYIEEAFKFIPQEQFIITTMEDYKKNEVRVLFLDILLVIDFKFLLKINDL